jgi:hypothetical protein
MKNNKGLFIKNPNFWRVPRKLKKKIPKNTHYCYTPTSSPGFMDDGRWGYTIKLCSFYDWRKIKNLKPDYLNSEDLIKYGEETVGFCKLVKCEIDDQCKSCGIKY